MQHMMRTEANIITIITSTTIILMVNVIVLILDPLHIVVATVLVGKILVASVVVTIAV